MLKSFTKTENRLWCFSIVTLIVSYGIFHQENTWVLVASMIGVTSLIFNAKGNPFGQLLMVIFSLFYGSVSFVFSYYGEMITYLGMTAPISIFALITWLEHPYQGNQKEVEVYQMTRQEYVYMIEITIVVTGIFYVILKMLETSSLFWSVLSIATSFIAVYLTYKRSAYYAIGYAMNDIVLIILWLLIARQDLNYVSMVICFAVFLMNDLYGFINWMRMQKRQGGK